MPVRRTTAPQPRFLSPDVIHLHRAGQPVSVQHRPRGSDLQRPLQAQGGDPVLPGRDPARGEPDGQRRARALTRRDQVRPPHSRT